MKKNAIIGQVILIAGILAPALWGQTPLAAPYQGVLILKNGSAMQGKITHEGEYFVLAINENSLVRLPAERVDFACRTLEEAYLRQKAKLGTTTLESHVQLANWCLNLDLWEEATYHHAIALRSGPDHPAVARLDRRYAVKKAEREKPAEIAQVGFTQPLPEPKPATPAVPADEADPIVPAQAVHYFTTNVQPLLLNSCATSRCHAESAETSFRLVQFDDVRSIPRRMTLRNMNAALEFVDYDNLWQSPLLVKAGTRHGGQSTQQLSATQLRALQKWVATVGQTGYRRPSAAVSPVRPVAYETPITSPEEPTVSGLSETDATGSVPSIFGGNANRLLPGPPRPLRTPPKRAEVEEAPEVRDEMDPEIFNRRYHSQRQAPVFPE